MARFDLQDGDFGTALGIAAPIGETLFAMGLRHAAGRDDEADLVSAHMYFNLADQMGVEDAAVHRQDLAAMMSKAEIGRALRLAREWLARN
ncbi:sel1 repeat family protein [Aureimonas flava]|uniref:Sel1 repeat family protein n=1 Tax=Aureimonas flava TaxID=2320271 RepID=A0A3A1WJJ6_9HYPH|nr:sel1 repeat family protein [Aureimonas flava]RIY01320.1 sel1 repeat family protein [Aureimonas flava]